MITPDYTTWSHGELLASGDVITSLMNGYFESSIDSIKEIEISLLYMMQSSKEWNKAQKQFKESVMKANVMVEVFAEELPANIEFHYSEIYKCVTNVSKIEIPLEGYQGLNLTALYNSNDKFAQSINEELEDKIIRGEYEA